jgi:hypothetical protein
MNWFKLSKDIIESTDHKKHPISKLWDGTTIYEVDGNDIRSRLCVDFTDGGHGYIYDFIPKDEIWIEPISNKEDEKAMVLHEVLEYILTKYCKWEHGKAHEITSNVEAVFRSIGIDNGSSKLPVNDISNCGTGDQS